MKKNLILIAVFLFAYQASNAQTQKGTQTLGVNFSYNYNTDNDLIINPSDNNSTTTLIDKLAIFNIGPTYSYFIADKIELGVALSYGSTVENYAGSNAVNGPSKYTSDTYSGSIFVRKYFMYKDKIGFRTGPYISYSSDNTKSTYPALNAVYDSNSKTNSYQAGVSLDLVYYPSKSLGLSARIANLSYEHYKTNNGTQGNANGDYVNANFINDGLYLSAFYMLGSK